MQKRGSLLGLRPFIIGSVSVQSAVKTSLWSSLLRDTEDLERLVNESS